MSQIASFYLLKDGQRQELSNGDVYKRQPLDTLREEEGTEKIFDFRDKLEEVFTTGDGPEAVSYTHLAPRPCSWPAMSITI